MTAREDETMLTQHDAARLMGRLGVTERTGKYAGRLACQHITFAKGERKLTVPLWHRDRRLPISGQLDWAVGVVCMPCASIYRGAVEA